MIIFMLETTFFHLLLFWTDAIFILMIHDAIVYVYKLFWKIYRGFMSKNANWPNSLYLTFKHCGAFRSDGR